MAGPYPERACLAATPKDPVVHSLVSGIHDRLSDLETALSDLENRITFAMIGIPPEADCNKPEEHVPRSALTETLSVARDRIAVMYGRVRMYIDRLEI